MKKNHDTITKVQLFFLITQTQIGVGQIELPHYAFIAAKYDGWISVLLTGVLFQIIIFILWLLVKRFPNHTIFDFSEKVLGKLFGKIISLFYSGYFLLVASFLAASPIIYKWAFPYTPKWVVLMLSLSGTLYFTRVNLRILAKYNTLISMLILILIILVLTVYNDMRFENILPIGQTNFTRIFKGINAAFLPMIGYEFLLVIYPKIKENPTTILKTMSLINIFVTSMLTFFVLSMFFVFSPFELRTLEEPVLYILKSFDWNIIERLDIILIIIWVATVNTTVINYLFFASHGVGHLFHKGDHIKAANYLPIISTMITLFLTTPQKLEWIKSLLNWMAYISLIGIPLFLMVISIISFKLKRRNEI